MQKESPSPATAKLVNSPSLRCPLPQAGEGILRAGQKPFIANDITEINQFPDQLIFITSPDASRILGAGYFKALCDLNPGITWIYDCGERTGDALAALREGVKYIAVSPSRKTPALVSLAAQQGAEIFTESDWC